MPVRGWDKLRQRLPLGVGLEIVPQPIQHLDYSALSGIFGWQSKSLSTGEKRKKFKVLNKLGQTRILAATRLSVRSRAPL